MLHYCMIMPYIRHNPSVLLHYATDMSCKLRRITELHTCRTSYNTPYASLLPDSSGRPACCTLPRHLRTRPMLHYRMIMPYIHHNSCTLNLTLLPPMCRDINPPASQNGWGTISDPVPFAWEVSSCPLRPRSRHTISYIHYRYVTRQILELPGKLKGRASFSTKIMFTPTIVFHSSRCALKLKHLLQPLQINHTSSAQPAQEVESVLPLYSASSDSVFFSFSVCPRLVFNLENFHSWYSLFSYSNFPLHT